METLKPIYNLILLINFCVIAANLRRILIEISFQAEASFKQTVFMLTVPKHIFKQFYGIQSYIYDIPLKYVYSSGTIFLVLAVITGNPMILLRPYLNRNTDYHMNKYQGRPCHPCTPNG